MSKMIDYMLLEIQEQPKFLKELLESQKEKIHEKVANAVENKNVKRIVLTGCGDSYCAALTGEYAFAKQSYETNVMFPMELSRYRHKFSNFINEKTLLIPISVSGRTPRVIETVHAAKSKNCTVLSITNNPESPLALLSDDYIYAKSSELKTITTTSYEGEISSKYVGYEHDVPQTKSYTAVQMTLLLIALSLQKDPNFEIIESVPETVSKIVGNKEIKELGVKSSESDRFIYCASGPNYGNALFAEFKMYEFSLMGFSKDIEEYCHTNYFMTEENTPVMFIAPEGESLKRLSEIAPVLKEKINAEPIILSNKEPDFKYGNWIKIPYSGLEEYSIIPYGIAPPIFAYWVAKEKGLNVNTFRGGIEQEKYVEGSYHTIRESKIKDDY
jgi:glucosamine--fructose-6-phosphate aminotransferase (isomerizing)